MVRRLAPLLALLVLAVPAPAHAAGCGKTPGLQCSELQVPLDYAGRTPGTLSLHVERLPAQGASRGVMFLIAGGPGQGSARAFDLGSPSSAAFLRFIFPGYTLVAFDNRGTGASGVLSCPALQSSTSSDPEQGARLAGECAAATGPARQFYATRDHAEDIESVRRTLGVQKVGLFGVSYGTKLALAYAQAFPAQVERLVLDSVLPVDFPDPFTTNVLRAMPVTLASYCPGSSCSAATADFAGEAVALANELEAAPVSGPVHLANGGTATVRVSGDDLLSTLIQADLDPGLAAELPAAVHAARAGVPGPLLRLVYLTGRLGIEPEKDLGTGLYAATTCDDGLFPWSPDTPVGERPSTIAAAIAALPPGALGPFGPWAAHSGSAEFCKLWPTPAGRAPLGPGPLPDVPVLAISGGLDLRTPTADAARVASLFPHGHLLLVPGVGHSVLTNDFSFCSQRAVRSWLTGGAIPSVCGRVSAFVAPLGPFPTRPASRAPATTLAVASATIREAVAAWLQTQGSSGATAFPGLAGGKLVPAKRFSGFTLVRYALAPGVQVSGTLRWISPTLPFAFRGTVRVTGGAAAAGKLRVLRHRLTGTLGGRRVAGHV